MFKIAKINEASTSEFEKLAADIRTAVSELMSGKLTEEEIEEYATDIVKAATKSDFSENVYWGYDKPENMPGDCRVVYVYNPTYSCVAFLIKALEIIPKLKCDSDYMDVLSKGLSFAMGRGFMGHGYECMEEFRENMSFFLKIGVDKFVEENPELSVKFTDQFAKATGFIMDMAEMGDEPFEGIKYADLLAMRDMSIDWKHCWKSDIDDGIRDIIITLNKKGYKTTACCEGHPERVGKNSSSETCIIFAQDYQFAVELPYVGNNKGIVGQYKKGRYYCNTRRGIKLESKESDKKKIITAIREWADRLPSQEV